MYLAQTEESLGWFQGRNADTERHNFCRDEHVEMFRPWILIQHIN